MKSISSIYCFVSACLTVVSSQSTTYSCPGLSQDPVVVPADSGSPFTRQINKSSSNTVCLLVRVTARTSNANLESIRRNSNNEDYYIVPVARSYNSRNWERVAGPYAQDLSISNCCTLSIPNLSNLDDGKFVLMSFTHQPSNQETVSRFFQQTTFGPTLEMINDWNYGNDMTREMGKWVKTQMDESETPVSSHRAYFRERADIPLDVQSADGYRRPRHPCAKYARWREYSFYVSDYNKELVVTRRNGKFLITIDGHPRTLRNRWRNEDSGENKGTGTFRFCYSTEERLDGEVYIVNQENDDCFLVYNERPNLPSGLQDSTFQEVDLPNQSSFGTINPIPAQNYFDMYIGEGLYLKNELKNADCSAIDENGNYRNVIGTFPNGNQAYYAGHAILDENTVENPIADGGNAMMNIDITDYYNGEAYIHCPVAAKSFLNINSCYLSARSADACFPAWTESEDRNRAVVCGSPNEVANDPLKPNIFTFYYNEIMEDAYKQKKDVWNMIALTEADQLRQRMAWALSQIIVVTPNQINDDSLSEIYLNYYDIFVRHAFGNYFDILKEVSYSPMMAEMLSYLDSKSSAWVLEETGGKSYPDENYAREVMQLFSIGLYELNVDGTQKLDGSGNKILSYDNTDIQNFARAWTGFKREYTRANFEIEWWDWENRMDTMKVRGEHRDPFPKMDLSDGFIGDRVPLCVDLPEKHFLKKGAQYRLLGSSPQPDIHNYGWQWYENRDWFDGPENEPLLLDLSSNLRSKLETNDIIVTLDSDIVCTGNECNVDSLIVVKAKENPPIYYEYVRPPCVELAFYNFAKKISSEDQKSMCGNPDLDSAHDACCKNPNASDLNAGTYCYYDFERTTHSTAKARCQNISQNGDLCNFHSIVRGNSCKTREYSTWMQDKWYWTDEDCTTQVKVNEEGNIAVVHIPPLKQNPNFNDRIDLRVHPDNTNYFKVSWDSIDYPKPSNSCGNGSCQSTYRGCLCDLNVVESRVFDSLPSVSQIINNLHIGSIDPALLSSYSQVSNTGTSIKVWHKNGEYDKDTIFSITYRQKEIFLKNTQSTVQVGSSTKYQFRNPPTFMNLGFREKRDAMYETDEVLGTYFWNDNVGPFLAVRLIQRFGISNPSPRYIEAVATAFQQGTYANPDTSGGDFGDGRYGNLEAMVAAIILDPEARSAVLDSDPTSGSLVEPMLKITRLLRAMKFEKSETSGERLRLVDLQQKIGQEPHSYPNVFSFFRPEYTAPGHIKAASITSPEAQVLSGPKVVTLLNGIISLVDLGLNNCFSGFGERTVWWCEGLESYYTDDDYDYGKLEYSPSNSGASKIVDELSLLLAAGRLGPSSTQIIRDAYAGESNAADGLRIAQKLIVTTPEFHTTAVFDKSTASRPEVEKPTSSNKRYKAIVFMMLDGGSDSHNMLVPHSGCSGGKTSYEHYAKVRGAIAIPKADLLQIDASSSSQVCSTFGVHPNLPHLKSLYDGGDLLWMANIGVLQQQVTENNWWELTDDTVLFAHNIQYEEVHNMDIYENQVGRGVGGRMADVMKKNGYSSTSVSLDGIADAVVSDIAPTYTLDPFSGLEKLNPMSWAQPLWENIKKLNSASSIGSSLFGETWSNTLFKAVGENDLLKDTLDAATLDTSFPLENDFAKQFELVSKLIKTQTERGVEREVFYVQQGGYDTHDNIKVNLDQLTTTMNEAVQSFTTEMKAQNAWDDVTLVMVSEFARTLPGNTGAGSDHAWGGNYFIAGGEVKGKRIIGEYPDILSEDGNLIFEPGIVIPTKSWDAPWYAMAQWFGVTNDDDLNEILPNKNNFPNNLFSQGDVYTTGPTAPTAPTPTGSTTPSPTPSPTSPTLSTPSPSTTVGSDDENNDDEGNSSSCQDSPFRFRVTKSDGNKISRDCIWVANRATSSRCKLNGVKKQCPSTCQTCSTCVDSTLRFKFKFEDKGMITRDCVWVANRNTKGRCRVEGMADTCRDTCDNC